MRSSILLAGTLGLGLAAAAGTSRKIVLFDGKTLQGWEFQGTASWTVSNGLIVGHKTAAQTAWAHLVSKQSFTDAYFRVVYAVDSGNSGAYVRSAIGGEFGVTGLQVEMGGNDGSFMTVTAKEWKWMDGNPVANPGAPLGQFHQLDVQVKGQSVSSFVNGKAWMSRSGIDTALMPTAGRLAFQLHSGNKTMHIRLKEVVAYVPTLITGCADSAFVEYDPQVNEPDSAACVRRKTTAIAGGTHARGPRQAASPKRWDALGRPRERSVGARVSVKDAGGERGR